MKKIKKIREFVKYYYDRHQERLQKDYPGLPFKRFLEEYCEFDHSTPDDDFFMENPAFFEKVKLGIPLEYINFKSFFYTNEFYVNQDVLIPRSETEILVEKAIDYIQQNYHDDFIICDIGTGSGAIALTIATEIKRSLTIIATDISKDALEVAKINHDNLQDKIQASTKVSFEIRDRLEGDSKLYDLILSNPPYIKLKADAQGVHGQVHTYEPHLALYLQDQEYDQWFEILFQQILKHLKPKGVFIIEGHEDNLIALQEMASDYFSFTQVLKDYTGRDRFLWGKK